MINSRTRSRRKFRRIIENQYNAHSAARMLRLEKVEAMIWISCCCVLARTVEALKDGSEPSGDALGSMMSGREVPWCRNSPAEADCGSVLVAMPIPVAQYRSEPARFTILNKIALANLKGSDCVFLRMRLLF